jgi:hypothetical protein
MYSKRFNFDAQRFHTLKRIFSFRCVKCGRKETPGDTLHADHIVPWSKGGSPNLANIQPLCQFCNCSKSNKNSIDYRLTFYGRFDDERERLTPKTIRFIVNCFLPILDPGGHDLEEKYVLDILEGWELEGEVREMASTYLYDWLNEAVEYREC